MPTPDQLPLPLPLPKGFKLPGLKTLKPDVDSSLPLGSIVEDGRTWLNQQEQYSRIEFKYGRNFIVIAKLKD